MFSFCCNLLWGEMDYLASYHSMCIDVRWLFWMEKCLHVRICITAIPSGTMQIMENMASWRPRNKLGEKKHIFQYPVLQQWLWHKINNSIFIYQCYFLFFQQDHSSYLGLILHKKLNSHTCLHGKAINQQCQNYDLFNQATYNSAR